MGVFKILGGALAGVGLMVAAPVLAPIGAITAVGAALGAGAGALAGAIASESDEDAKKQARNDGYASGKAQNAAQIAKLVEALQKAQARLTEEGARESFLTALFAVGVAVANADGVFSESEKSDLDEACLGLSAGGNSAGLREMLEKIKATPLSFGEALEYAKKIDEADWGVIDTLIEIIINADGKEDSRESACRAAWQQFKNENQETNVA